MNCVYCGEELWGHRERNGVCCSCQGLPLDEGGDLAGSASDDEESEDWE